jgi:hypothetical protein
MKLSAQMGSGSFLMAGQVSLEQRRRVLPSRRCC